MSIFIVGVAGGSCSGKTTLVRALNSALPNSAILYQDSYYFDQSSTFDSDGGSVNFDHPSSLDFELMTEHLRMLKQGYEVGIPVYDFATHSRQPQTTRLAPPKILLIDGILILTQPELVQEMDLTIYIECDQETRLTRRLKRDVAERGRSENGVRSQFSAQVQPMHQKFVEPSKKISEIVLSQSEYQAEVRNGLQNVLQSFPLHLR